MNATADSPTGDDPTADGPRADVPADVLEIRSLSKSFGGERALDGADLRLRTGEMRGLVGANGSGKSTLVKVLAGFHRPDAGSGPILVDGVEVDPAAGHGVEGLRFIHQDLALVPDLTVAENLALRRGQDHVLRPLRPRRESTEIRQLLADWDLDFGPERLVGDLPAVERTMVAVVRAFRRAGPGVRVLVLDEVTATLPPDETHQLFERIARMRDLSVILVSHRIEEVLDHCDSVTVLRDGRVVADRPTAGLTPTDLVRQITGSEPEDLFPALPSAGEQPLLDVRGLCGSGIRDLDLEVHKGEIVGLASLNPQEGGRVLRMLCGETPRQDGEVTIGGESLARAAGTSTTSAYGMTLVADRLESGIATFTLRENLTMNGVREFVRSGLLRLKAEQRQAEALVEDYSIRPSWTETPFAALSGGNQQKAVLAKSMRRDPKLLLLDDPTRGVDVGARALLYKIIREAADRGLGVLIASTEFEELCGLCHRVIVLREGRAAEVLSGGQLTPPTLLERCYLAGNQAA